ncbi:unnamed protein product [Amaranthus hypochondriacus]
MKSYFKIQLINLAALLNICSLMLCSAENNNESDWMALLQIKAQITGDPLRVTRSWNNSVHFCDWYGVTCGHKHQRVTALHLQSAKLTGTTLYPISQTLPIIDIK